MPVFQINGKTILFIHIPKTGGTSIENVLSAHGTMSFHNRNRHFRDQFAGGWLSKPVPMQHFHGKFLQRVFDERSFDLIFTVVRDPVQRLVSEYRHSRQRRRVDARLPFSQWLRVSLAARMLDPGFRNNHLRPQGDFLFGPCQVFHFEDGLDRIMTDVARAVGLPPLGMVPHERPSINYPVRLSEADLERIARSYRGDYQLFPRYTPYRPAIPPAVPVPTYLTGGA